MFEKYTASVTVGSKEVTLNLYDTAGECACVPRVPGSARRDSPAGVSPAGHPGPVSLCGALTSHHSWRPRRGAGWGPVNHRLESKKASVVPSVKGGYLEEVSFWNTLLA